MGLLGLSVGLGIILILDSPSAIHTFSVFRTIPNLVKEFDPDYIEPKPFGTEIEFDESGNLESRSNPFDFAWSNSTKVERIHWVLNDPRNGYDLPPSYTSPPCKDGQMCKWDCTEVHLPTHLYYQNRMLHGLLIEDWKYLLDIGSKYYCESGQCTKFRPNDLGDDTFICGNFTFATSTARNERKFHVVLGLNVGNSLWNYGPMNLCILSILTTSLQF